MKKIMILLAAITLGVVANAASVTWMCTAVSTKLSDGTSANGVIAYLFEGSLSDTVLESIAGGTWDASTSGYIASKNTTSTGLISQSGIGSYENETVSFSMILFNSDSYATATEFKYAEVNNVEFVTANKTAAFSSPLSSATWQAVAVPEPTSGLLMLVGLAGLALRRRRA